MPMFISLSILLACTDSSSTDDTGAGHSGGDGGSSGLPCVETETPLSEATAPTTVEEVWPLIEAWHPTTITWSRAPDAWDSKSVPFAATFTQAGDAVVVTRTGGDVYSPTHPNSCRPGPELRIPISVEVTVDGGSASAHFDGSLDAQGATYPLAFFRLDTSVDTPPTLSSEWLAAAEEELAERWGSDATIDSIESWFNRGEYEGDWLPRWGIGATGHTEDAGITGVLWTGDLPAPE